MSNQEPKRSKAVRTFDALTQNTEFRNDVARKRKKLKIPAMGFSSPVDLDEDYVRHYARSAVIARGEQYDFEKVIDNLPTNLLEAAADSLIRNHKISPFWQTAVCDYLLYDERSKVRPTSSLEIRQHHYIGKDVDHLEVLVDANATREEWLDAWKTVGPMLKSLRHNRTRGLRQFKPDRLEDGRIASELKQSNPNMSGRSIAEYLNARQGTEYGQEDVSKLIDGYKKKQSRT